jgi:hypothetical protein
MRCWQRRWVVLRSGMAYGPEFQEIAHCGGKFIVTVSTANGQRGVSFGVEHSAPRPASWFAVYALPQGIPVGTVEIGGIAQPWNPAPYPSCLPVFIGSDSEGLFGHQCPACNGYWRSTAVPALWNLTCPYCGTSGATHQFLTVGQKRFVEAVCELTWKAFNADADGEHTIDMDAIADNVAKTSERPAFYYTEEKQQNHYKCVACGIGDDILGRYGYCSFCGTRNDLQELTATIDSVNAQTRDRIKAGNPIEAAVPDAVSAFDSVARQYAKQLAKWVPMKRARRAALEGSLFHNFKRVDDLKPWFDIDVFDGLDADDVAFIRLMFCRRHVYEHNGGEVDQKYLDDSGDTTVRLKQALRETPDRIFRMTGLILHMARNVHEGFHELFPPMEKPIKMHKEQQERLKAYGQRR